MSKLKRILAICFLAIGLTSCDTLTQIYNQAAEMVNLKNCTFDINNINNIQMLGVNLSKGMSKSDLNLAQLAKLTNAIVQKTLPVTFNVNLNVKNPNSIAASMSKMDYIVSLNGKQVISSSLNKKLSVGANSTGTFSIPISTDLFQLFSNSTTDAIINLAFKLAGASSDPVDLGVQVKPYITVNNQSLAYPEYISLSKTLN